MGGNSGEGALALALDSEGNVYVAGLTSSSDFPGVDAGSADNTFVSDNEGFVAKLNGDLSTVLAATFLGGSGADVQDDVSSIALDSAGNVYVAGNTGSADFPGVDAGSPDSVINTDGTFEAYVAKLDGDLSTILAATFLGGDEGSISRALVLDSVGNVYVVGLAFSADQPGVDDESADPTFGGEVEGFVTKLDGDLSTILVATFLGGNHEDEAVALALDNADNVYVAGQTDSSNFPGIGPGSADSTYAGGEYFVAVLDPDFSCPEVICAVLEFRNFLATCAFCPPEVLNSLLNKINQALKHLQRENPRAALNALQQFVQHTERFIRKGQLSAAEGGRFIGQAQAIMEEIGSQGR